MGNNPTIYMPKSEEAVPTPRTAAFEYPANVPAREWSTGEVTEKRAAEEAVQKQAEATEAAEVEKEFVARHQRDRESAINVMREKWEKTGTTMDDIDEVVKLLPPRERELIKSARVEDGTALLNSPKALEKMGRIVEIHKYRRERRSEYNNNDRMQAENLHLLRELEALIA